MGGRNMAKDLSYFWRLFKQWKHEHFMVPEGTMVILTPGTNKKWSVQAIDISQGGSAFIYQRSEEDLHTWGTLKKLAKNASFETVSDKRASGSTGTSLPSQRPDVKFAWMGAVEKENLRDFINNISI
jgi:hypothetical protein